jgi:hypothetical protein
MSRIERKSAKAEITLGKKGIWAGPASQNNKMKMTTSM